MLSWANVSNRVDRDLMLLKVRLISYLDFIFLMGYPFSSRIK